VKELAKLAPLVRSWHLPKLGYVLAVVLLFERVVDFNQALILILLALVIDWSLRGRRAPSALHEGKPKTAGSPKKLPPSG